MAPDAVPILIAVCLLLAFIIGVRAANAWRALDRASEAVLQRGVELEMSQATLPKRVAGLRAKLADSNAAVERALWATARFDERALALESSVRTSRAQIDDFRVRYVGRADEGLRRARGLVRTVKQLNVLRRSLLG